ncbi:MAG: SRPBCC family protein [Bacteroidetes bacterium]|nr:SRPBCC family protein [Bacteroidota bacterium]
MKTKSIRQTVTFAATPEQVYQLIMDQKKHAAFTGSKAVMSTKVNGKFSVFDGYCLGYNIELIGGKKIVQAWHFAEEGWPDDHFSTCTFLFSKVGDKTKLIFLQTGVPEENLDALREGWKQFYWEPMKAYLK